MKPLIVLLAGFALALLGQQIWVKEIILAIAGQVAMAVMLCFTAVAHFAFTRGMTMMLPDFVPGKTALVYLTGIIEIAAAIGLLIPAVQTTTAWSLIGFFILLLPANIYAAMHHVDYQKGTYQGNGLSYLWFRVPLQVLFIIWTYLCVLGG